MMQINDVVWVDQGDGTRKQAKINGVYAKESKYVSVLYPDKPGDFSQGHVWLVEKTRVHNERN